MVEDDNVDGAIFGEIVNGVVFNTFKTMSLGLNLLCMVSKKLMKSYHPTTFSKRITFASLRFLGRALRNYKITSVRDLSYEYSLKYPTGFYLYNVCYLSYG
jgi:hypothetical protein